MKKEKPECKLPKDNFKNSAKPNAANPQTPAELQPHNAKKEGLGPNTKR